MLIACTFGFGAAEPRTVSVGLLGRLLTRSLRFLNRFRLTTSPCPLPLSSELKGAITY
jgi:hypothetical protein